MGPARIDEHSVTVTAGPERVWSALLESVTRAFDRRAMAVYCRLVGSDDTAFLGPRPLSAGAELPGFRVTSAVPASELVLEGGHRFSRYAFVFRLEPLPDGRTRVRAESLGDFPGLSGRVYRAAVIGSGGHAAAVRRLLRRVAADVQRAPGTS